MPDPLNKNTPEIAPAVKQRKLKWGIALLVIVLLFVSLLPVGVRYGTIQALKQQGMQQAEIADIDINLFSGELKVTGMLVSGDGQGRARLDSLYVNLSMLALFKKQLKIENILLDGLILDVKNNTGGEWIVAGYRSPPAAESTGGEATTTSTWGIGIDSLQLKAIKTRLDLPQLQTILSLDELQIKQLASWLPQQLTQFNMQLRIDESPLNIDGEVQPFLAAPKLKTNVTLDKLPLALAKDFAAEANIKELTGTLTLSTNISATFNADQPHIEATTTLTLNELSLQQGQYKITANQFNWQGDVAYVTPISQRDPGVRASGNIVTEQFQLFDNDAALALVLLKQLAINDIRLIEEQQASVASILLKQLQLLNKSKEDELLNIASTSIEKIGYDGLTTVAIDNVILQGLAADIQMKQNGQLHLIDALTKTQNPATEAKATSDQNEPQPWRIKLARFHIDKSAHITFDDQSVKPPFHAEISPLELTIANIDTGAVEQAMDITLNSTINKHEKLNINASAQPFGEKLNAKAEVKISSLELPPLSPYIEKQIGYYLKRGQLDATIDVNVNNDQLDTKVLAHLNKFNIEEGDPARVESMTEKLDMPLDAALNLLRDKNDNIKLEVTIDGDINDPQFDASKVINKAMANATKMAVVSYLKHMLQPWGTLLTVVDMVSKATETRFEPLQFTAGSAELTDDNKGYLNKLATLMQERPKLVLNICGRASEQDRNAVLQQSQENTDGQQTEKNTVVPEATNAQLLQLATERTNRSKDWLVKSGVKSDRLFACYSDMEGVEKNAPIVDLSL